MPMAKSRRGVQFQHRGNSDANGRRPSMMEISEDASEPGSPSRRSTDGSGEVNKEEVCLTSTACATRANRLYLIMADDMTD